MASARKPPPDSQNGAQHHTEEARSSTGPLRSLQAKGYPEAMSTTTSRPAVTGTSSSYREIRRAAWTRPLKSWGRYPKYPAHLVPMHWQQDFPANIHGLHNGALPVGMGRSYGDSCLLKDGNLVVTTAMNRLLSFNPETGILTAEAGMTLAQILDFRRPARLLPARHPRHQVRYARRRPRQRHPRQEPSRRRHLRQPRHAV